MKLPVVFPLLIVIFVFQEQSSIFLLNISASPGYLQDGDFIIGGLFSLRATLGDNSYIFGIQDMVYLPEFVFMDLPKHYQHLLAMVFAVEEINKDLSMLFNMSLGFYIFNVDFMGMKVIKSSLSLLSGKIPPVPNYDCRSEKEGKLVAVVGGVSTAISTQSSHVLSLYNVPQIGYGPFDVSLRDRVWLQSFYQFLRDPTALYQGIIRLLLHFDWIWVGLVVPDDIRGEMLLKDMTQEMTNNKLCVAFVERIPEFPADNIVGNYFYDMKFTSTKVSVVFGDTYSLLILVYNIFCNDIIGNIFITTSDWDISTSPLGPSQSYTYFGGGLSFSYHMDEIPGFKSFLRSVQPAKYPHDIFIQDMWSVIFECPYLSKNGTRILSRCEQNGTLASRSLNFWDMNTSAQSYKVYAAVHAIAQALHEELSFRMEEESFGKDGSLTLHPWQLHPFLQRGQLKRSVGKEEAVDETTSATWLDVFNYQSQVNGTTAQVKVGEFIFKSQDSQHLSLNDELMMWGELYNETPSANNKHNCLPGYIKIAIEKQPFCCYSCRPCPDGEISNETNMDHCIKCPEDHYSVEPGEQCLPKVLTFLSYEDTLGALLVSVAISFALLNVLILGLFILYRHTPIVRANNRDLSYVLLVSLMLCFLCPLLFIGQPSPVSCVLRQVFFGIVFSVAVSAILAKTFIVVVAFRATKPGRASQMRMVTRGSNAIVFIGSLVQGCICTVWLGTSPPFPDVDSQSEFGHLVLQCNEGSPAAFYCVLGYLGFLALLSLMVAFLARRLPDTFNEAKMITFSMLVFCSVWICFIPTYLSTKGSAMVAVESFAILASSAGLLGCIFLPKCYVILLRSDISSTKKLLEQVPSIRQGINVQVKRLTGNKQSYENSISHYAVK